MRLAVIGSGQPADLFAFRQVTAFRGELYTDPTLASFQHLGLIRSVAGVLSLNMLGKGLRAWGEGHRQAAIQGDALQLGGAVVIAPGLVLRFVFRSGHAGDHPSVDQLLAACRPPTAGK